MINPTTQQTVSANAFQQQQQQQSTPQQNHISRMQMTDFSTQPEREQLSIITQKEMIQQQFENLKQSLLTK